MLSIFDLVLGLSDEFEGETVGGLRLSNHQQDHLLLLQIRLPDEDAFSVLP